ncbi:MAG: tryptophan synthase subunit alpha [Sarcina sp.]
MNRLEKKIKELEVKKERAFVGFIPLMYPTKELMIKAFLSLEKAGVDIIEIGFSENPYMDGEVIKAAYKEVNSNGVTCISIFEAVCEIRKVSELPIVFMSYKKDIEKLFCEDLKDKLIESGIDAMLIPDMDDALKEKIEFDEKLLALDIELVENEFESKNIKGFKYCISNKGVTGNKVLDKDFIITNAKKFSKNKNRVFIGFGMGDLINIKNLREYFGGVIIGTEIVKGMSRHSIETGILLKRVAQFSKAIK